MRALCEKCYVFTSFTLLLLVSVAPAYGAEQQCESSESLYFAGSASQPHADAATFAPEQAAAAAQHVPQPLGDILPAEATMAVQQGASAGTGAQEAVPTVSAPLPEQPICRMPGLHDLFAAAAGLQSRTNSSDHDTDATWQPGSDGNGICAEPKATTAEAAAAAQLAEQAAAAAKAAEEAAAAVSAEGVDEDEDVHDRHNFAAAKDGAKVLAANKEAKRAASILDSDGDTFMRNECKSDKWLIIELPQVIRPDTLRVSQHELYSSRIKDFEVRGRQKHPRHDAASGGAEPGSKGVDYVRSLNSTAWKLVGNFTAAKVKGTQSFKVDNPPWVKYLLLRFLTHHGSEPVCTINDIAVYGKSAAEDLEDRLGDDEGDSQAEAPALDPALLIPPPTPAVVPPPPMVPPPVVPPPQQAAAASVQQPAAAGASSQTPGTGSSPIGVGAGTGGHAAQAPAAADPRQAESALPTAQQAAGAADAHAAAATQQQQQQPPVTPIVLEPGGLPAPSADQPAVQPGLSAAQPQALPPENPVSVQPTAADFSGAGPTPAQLATVSNTSSVSVASIASSDGAAAATAEVAGKAAMPVPQAVLGKQPASTKVTPKLATPESEDKDFPLRLQSSRYGKSVYDLLVQEIKAIKLQQKSQPRQVAELQGSMAAAAAEVAALKQRLQSLESAVALGAEPPQPHPPFPDQLLNLTAQVNALRAQLQSGRRREMGLLGLLVGLTALALPRLALGKFGGVLRMAVLALAAANSLVGLGNYVVSHLAEGLPAVRLSDLGFGELSRRPAMPELPLQLLT